MARGGYHGHPERGSGNLVEEFKLIEPRTPPNCAQRFGEPMGLLRPAGPGSPCADEASLVIMARLPGSS